MPSLVIQSFSRPGASAYIDRVSTGVGGTQADGASLGSRLSGDGRYLVFTSEATNLVADDRNDVQDVFRKDLVTGEVIRVSIGHDAHGNVIDGNMEVCGVSANGRYILMSGWASNLSVNDIFRKDLVTGELIRITTGRDSQGNPVPADRDTFYAAISADGQTVVFSSKATNLVANDTNSSSDVFRWSASTGEITRLSVSKDAAGNDVEFLLGSYQPTLSGDGRYAFFLSEANILGPGYVWDVSLYRIDLNTGAITDVSSPKDAQGNLIRASDDVFSPAGVSENGRYIVFRSKANNLVPNDTNNGGDVFWKDLETGETRLASTSSAGVQSSEDLVSAPTVSNDGRFVYFNSTSANLVDGDTNGSVDIFRKDMVTGETIRLSAAVNGVEANRNSSEPFLSADGRKLIFSSSAINLVTGDTNETSDIFVVSMDYLPHRQALVDGRHVEATFAVGAASKMSIAWGDGTVDLVTPAAGSAAVRHTYASAGTKDVVITVTEGEQTWAVPHTIDMAAGRMVRNTALFDTLSGLSGPDRLTGDGFANRLMGQKGKDVHKGLAGHDVLWGGADKDTLYGGSGKDVFVFDTKSSKKKNLDTIRDFNVKDDTIWLDNKVFKKLGKKGSEAKPAKLNKKFFSLEKAKGKDDYLV
ncbi:hypothetical protein [Microvirga lenta]|uniref:hypothetical protein n=1 Tax=Microvirga lenta TaxID=2881337 RepID=UPI001CFF8585|nr:hypothetical protein [Microvirga lenta]MCB5176973.1 hypothetical protein [Microvirga lenta]